MSTSWILRCIRTYHRLLVDKPVITKSVTCGILSFTGDIIAQTIEHKYSMNNNNNNSQLNTWRILSRIDMGRTLRFTSFGFLIFGPSAHYWYRFLDKLFPKPTTQSLLSKVLADQTLFTPVAIVSVFSYISLLEGHSSFEKVRQDFWPTLKANWALWLPAQTINFRFTPPDYRVLFVNSVALIWNVYLASASASPVSKQDSLTTSEEIA